MGWSKAYGFWKSLRNSDAYSTVILREGGDPVRRGFSIQSLPSLEYWINRFRG